jgi:hypothetical protein
MSFFRRRRAAHEELTDKKNARILGTLTSRAWRKLAVLEARAKYLDLSVPPEKLEHPLKGLIQSAIESSGSIGGEHRKDLVEAIKNSPPPPSAGISIQQQAPSTPPSESGI